MQEINEAKQESIAQDSKKLFVISWTEQEQCSALVRARSKKEVLELFYNDDDQLWENVDFTRKEMVGEPRVEEVDEA